MERLIASRFLIMTFLTIAVFISGCGLLADDSDDFEMEAQVEGQEWEGSSTARLTEDDILYIRGQQGNDNCNHESISIGMAGFEGAGDCEIYNNSYAQLIGCDGVASFGHSFDTTGTATISAFDEESGIVEGQFQFELIARYDHENLRDGEPFTVTGRFRAKIDTTD